MRRNTRACPCFWYPSTDRASRHKESAPLTEIEPTSSTTAMSASVDAVAARVARPGPDGERRIEDGSVAYRLGRSAARLEAALSTPSIFGRVAQAQTMRDIGPDLMDIAGPASVLPIETEGAADDGASNYLYRFAPLAGIYGGTLEVFRNMIAQHVLGLGKPSYLA